LFFAQGVGRVVRARGNHESATVFLPAVRPLLALAAELEDERNHIIPPPAQQSEELLDVERVEPEPGESDRTELVDADASFAHILHGGRAVVAAPEQLTPEDEDFLGLPGILSPEQMASLLAHRDTHARNRVAGLIPTPSADPVTPAGPTSSWRAGAELRREVNRLVGIYAARTGTPHGQIHAQLRREVPGPASAAASAELLERRRDRLMELVGS
jgi:hypothetical protein